MMPSAVMTPGGSSGTLPGHDMLYPTDMDVDADDSLALLDAHDTPTEKMDADFFNGAPAAVTPPIVHARALPPLPRSLTMLPPSPLWSVTPGSLLSHDLADFEDDFDDEDLQ